MASTWYVDYVGGNNGNTGASFAQRVKTILGIAGKGVAAGDTVRIMKSPDPTAVGSCTWTSASTTVVIPSGTTKDIDMCETVWTAAGVGITLTADSALTKQGSFSAKMVIGGGYVAGTLMAYKTLSSTDYSGYQQVSFWFLSSAATAAGDYELRLCSDTVGLVTVNTIAVPAIVTAAKWQAIVVDTAGALGATIQSVALYRIAGAGTPTVQVDGIFAAKASSNDASLTLWSLIGKNDGRWYPIQSITGTTLKIDNSHSYSSTGYQDFYGTTQTLTSYKREPIHRGATATESTALSGTITADIIFDGGWDTTAMSSKTGDTFYLCSNSQGTFFTVTGSRLTFNNLWFVGAATGVNFISNKLCTFNNGGIIGQNACGLLMNAATSCGHIISGTFFWGGDSSVQFYGDTVSFTNCFLGGSNSYGVLSGANMFFDTCYMVAGAGVGYRSVGVNYGTHSSGAVLRNCVFAQNNSGDILCETGNPVFDNCLFASTTEFSDASYLGSQSKWFSTNHDQTANSHKIFMQGGVIISDTSNRHTASGICWKMSPTSTNRTTRYPMRFRIARIYVRSGTLVTVKAWMYRDSSSITGKLHVRGGQIGGPASDTETAISGSAAYEQVTVTWTPTIDGVVEIEALAYGGTTLNVYVDDFTATQA